MTTTTQRITTAVEGAEFVSLIGPENEEVRYTVGPSCGENTGRWYCIDHDLSFGNNLGKDNHIDRGRHRMAWICFQHGAEQP